MADVDIVLKISGVEGNTEIQGFSNQIALQSATWSFSRPLKLQSGQSTDRSNGAPSASEIYIVKERDKASGPMLAALMQGKVFTSPVIISYLTTDGSTPQAWRTLTLTNVILSQYNTTTSNGGHTEEHYTLSPTEINIVDKIIGDSGTPTQQSPLVYNYSTQKVNA